MSKPWHSLTAEEAIKELNSSVKGLSSEEAKKRLSKYGLNEVEVKAVKTPIRIFLSQFKNILIIALLAAIALSVFLGRVYESIAIAAIVGIAVMLGFAQEYKAEKTIEALCRQAPSYAKVLRDGRPIKINVLEIVPGDIVLFEAGDKIPADLRLIESHSLMIDESILIGESIPVAKDSSVVLPPEAPIYERVNMAYMGTCAVNGRGVGLVVATGLSTELGKIAKLVKKAEEETEAHRSIEKLGRKLVSLFAILCAIFFIHGALTGGNVIDMLIAAIALAVAAIPEGLPAAVTIALALGVRRMASRNVIVRKLNAIQSMGPLTVICTDKTGTLTKNEMTVKSIWLPGIGLISKPTQQKTESLDLLLKASALCHNANLLENRWSGDPTDLALIDLAEKNGIDVRSLMAKCPRLSEIPFDPKLKLMAVLCKLNMKNVLIVKGAPEAIIEKCTAILTPNGREPLKPELRREIIDAYQMMASKGERVLALAYKEPIKQSKSLIDELRELTLIGFVGLMDPPREGVHEAVKACHQAGIKVLMLTGDNPTTAKAIALELGITSSEAADVVLSEELKELKIEELSEKLKSACAVARATPEDKLKIVQALKMKGETVAMTGDGVNDAPALKMADVGVAMGLRGSDVAKEASHVILTDDNFASLVAGIMEGRTITENIRKAVTYLLTTSFAILFLVFASSTLLGARYIALNALQILMLNIVLQGVPALAISFDEPSQGIMKLHPRHFQNIVTWRSIAYPLIYGGVVSIILLMAYMYMMPRYGFELSSTTMYVATSTMLLASLYFIRLIYRSSLLRNVWIHVAVASSFLIQLLTIYYEPIGTVFKCVPLTLEAWCIVALLTAIPIVISVMAKIVVKAS
ncbi:MAG: cation-translocating P-type ATPase [Candidatus Nezhaarchaeales archaeon]